MNVSLHWRVSTVLLVALAACGGGGDSASAPKAPTVATVEVTPSSVTLNVGEARQFAAAPRDAAGALVAGKTATWASSNPAVASVDVTGLVRGLTTGTTMLTATIDGKVGSSTVTVANYPVAVVTLAPTTLSVLAGNTATLTATLTDVSGNVITGRTVTWSSANTAVATVNAIGMVTGMAAGTTTITATSEGRTATVPVTVAPNPAVTFAISGRVVEVAGTPGVNGARVTASDQNAIVIATTTTDANGNWSLPSIASGSVLQFAVSAAGYVSTTVQAMTVAAAITVETVPLARVGAAAGGLSGKARDASTNAVIASGAAVELRDGVNATTGLALQSTTTAADGSYSLTGLSAGTYTLTMRAAGYAQTSRTVAVASGATTSNADLTLSANANANQWRAVLSWVGGGRDLDLYLTLPGAGTARQQVYFLQPGNCAAAPFACLDRDAAGPPGPETITISQLGTGVYRFYVQNYNAPSSAADSTLMFSGAQVRVFRGTAQMASYAVPQQGGTLWTVFELDGATGTITPKNTMSAGAPGDPTLALRASSTTGKRDPGLRLP